MVISYRTYNEALQIHDFLAENFPGGATAREVYSLLYDEKKRNGERETQRISSSKVYRHLNILFHSKKTLRLHRRNAPFLYIAIPD